MSSTINPLHFEDFEPHRFEDLVRQLAYRFRNWRTLEATGRLGGDKGIDIRGIEARNNSINHNKVQNEDISTDSHKHSDETAEADREWRIQCKRQKTIGPNEIRGIVRETIEGVGYTPYGLIIAAACDVSAETMSAFHDEAISLGVTDHRLWTRSHLEDMLFQPENDNLLFAYFGISLNARRQSQSLEARLKRELTQNIISLTLARKGKLLERYIYLTSIRTTRSLNMADIVNTKVSLSFKEATAIYHFVTTSIGQLHDLAVRDALSSGEFMIYDKYHDQITSGQVHEALDLLRIKIERLHEIKHFADVQWPTREPLAQIMIGLHNKLVNIELSTNYMVHIYEKYDILTSIFNLSKSLLQYIGNTSNPFQMPTLGSEYPFDFTDNTVESENFIEPTREDVERWLNDPSNF